MSINKNQIRAALNMDAPQAIPVPVVAPKVFEPVTTCYFKTVDDLLAKVRESKGEHAAKFFAYFDDGEVDKYNSGDESSADASFCVILAYWTNRDAEMMDEVFRLSKLMRTKADSPGKFWVWGTQIRRGRSTGHSRRRESP
jgi:primase-polymerase (primpol)-like protein